MYMSFSNVKKYFKFHETELLFMLVTICISGFILSFRKWGIGSAVDINFGIFNLVLGVAIVALNLFVSMSVIKIMGLKIGHNIKFSFGKFSTLISLFVVFLSDGLIPFFAPGTFKSKLIYRYRLGRLRPGLQLKDLAKLSYYGSFSSLIIAIIAKLFLYAYPANYVLDRIMVLSIIFAIVSMLPFPEFNGFHVFFSSRLLYAFIYTAIIVTGLFLLFLGVAASISLAILIGVAVWFFYYVTYERQWE
ncbi:hypothetical protein KY337_00300 [Candidatus Woesearchaeota archaeon]|nr:hypothetical protein [Candidatus Woesearchaeota archaeon]